MKPLGLTMDFRVSRPTRAEDQIYEAVRTAIYEGMTPERFKMEAAEAWTHHLKEAADDARKELLK